MAYQPPAVVKTSLPREEAWELDDAAHDLGVRRSHVVRAMIRYVMTPGVMAGFLAWYRQEEGSPAVAVEDPMTGEVHRGKDAS